MNQVLKRRQKGPSAEVEFQRRVKRLERIVLFLCVATILLGISGIRLVLDVRESGSTPPWAGRGWTPGRRRPSSPHGGPGKRISANRPGSSGRGIGRRLRELGGSQLQKRAKTLDNSKKNVTIPVKRTSGVFGVKKICDLDRQISGIHCSGKRSADPS